MLRHLRIAALIATALAVAVAVAVAGCGGVPSNGVAKVGDTTITKTQFNHWLNAAAHGSACGRGRSGCATGCGSPAPIAPFP